MGTFLKAFDNIYQNIFDVFQNEQSKNQYQKKVNLGNILALLPEVWNSLSNGAPQDRAETTRSCGQG